MAARVYILIAATQTGISQSTPAIIIADLRELGLPSSLPLEKFPSAESATLGLHFGMENQARFRTIIFRGIRESSRDRICMSE